MDEKHLNSWFKKRAQRRENLSAVKLLPELLRGDINALSSSITLLESSREDDRLVARDLLKMVLPHTGNSIRIGITGVPGVGKSTFIESFGKVILDKGMKLAVLAIDPSSSQSGGSILGDKTRMQDLSVHPNVFIRPSAAGETLGGVARKTRESIYLCEAAGFDVVLIETVGVGQSETLVHSMVDFFLLLMLSGAGDELQGIKRGIMEMADALVITKADGDNVKKSELAARQYANAMHLFPPKKSDWIAQTMTCSSLEHTNIDKIWDTVETFRNTTKINGWWEEHRKQQDKYWLRETLKELILHEFFSDEEMLSRLKVNEQKVFNSELGSFEAAEELYREFQEKKKK
jgi:LAO/AO transport system kinase